MTLMGDERRMLVDISNGINTFPILCKLQLSLIAKEMIELVKDGGRWRHVITPAGCAALEAYYAGLQMKDGG